MIFESSNYHVNAPFKNISIHMKSITVDMKSATVISQVELKHLDVQFWVTVNNILVKYEN